MEELNIITEETQEVKRKPFETRKGEVAGALLMGLSCIILTRLLIIADIKSWWIIPAGAMYVAAVLLICSDRKPSAESCFWLCCYAVCTVMSGIKAPKYEVWDRTKLLLFSFLYGCWWLLSRAGVLTEGLTGRFVLTDVSQGLIAVPCKNLLLREKVIFRGLTQKRTNKKVNIGWNILSAVVAVLVLIPVVSLLFEANKSFESFVDSWGLDELNIFIPNSLDDNLGVIFIGLLHATVMFAAAAGNARRSREECETPGKNYCTFIAGLGKTNGIWIVILLSAAVFYALFIFFQLKELLAVFYNLIPYGTVISEYAREGFFSLCKVTGLNFLLLWLAEKLSDEETINGRLFKATVGVFMLENLIFCISAASKLGLYIMYYGFTPLRFQSSWLVVVLTIGCILKSITVMSRKRTFRLWVMLSSVLLCLLAVI